MTRPEDPADDLATIRDTYDRYAREGRATLWDRTNPGYDRLSTDRDQALLATIRASIEAPTARLLDVGCGTGSLAELIASDLPAIEVLGFDLLEDRIIQARERVPSATFVVGSADDMDLPHASFDLAAALTLFSSLPSQDLERAVAHEIGRVLRPGGWLIWYDLRFSNPSNPAVHGLDRRRLTALFPGWRQEVRSIGVAPPVARRLGRLTPVLYPTIHAIGPLRSHLVGRLRRPEDFKVGEA
jgi:ubiquinone/menaquinone biosynthesis C-methylase UbiE